MDLNRYFKSQLSFDPKIYFFGKILNKKIITIILAQISQLTETYLD